MESTTKLFLGVGIVLLALKYLEMGPVAAWPWWVVLSPFGLAVAWWAWADWSGYTKKKAVERENAKKQARIDKSREALGQGDAVAKLAGKIQKGGAGVWGPVPMPANPQVSEAEATKLAQWVLSQK